jgi:Tfp pilus assembly protein FimT
MGYVSKPKYGQCREAGLGLMEAIVGLLVILIVGSVLLHLGKMGFAMYRLNAATGGIAEELEFAREQAIERRATVSVIFDAHEEKFGLDRNGNGRLDSIEAEDLPDGVAISDNAVVIFARSGNLAPGSKQPNIIISNTTKSRRVSVSKSGSIEID